MDKHFKRLFTLILLLLIIPAGGWCEIKIDIDMPTEFYENSPMYATIIVSHSKNDKINLGSFKLDNQPIEVELQREQVMTARGDLVLSMYRFLLPAAPKGLHILPRIKLSVAGKEYQSTPRTYEVKTADSPRAPTREQEAKSKPFLRLEAFINGPQELFPGQRTTLGYRYFFNSAIEMTNETMPLLAAEGLVKIGDKIIKNDELDGIYVQQIEQMVEAAKPGEYTFGPSTIEGRPYENALGRRVYGSQLLSSSVPPITLSVKPFPETGKPASFNGALGSYLWQVSLKSPSTVTIGEEVELLVEAAGSGNIESLNLPELCCQPGMSGLFKLNDLPAVGKVEGKTKRFTVKLRPLSTAIKAIPQLEFSSFDPDAGKYIVFHSKPIPLEVIEPKNQPTNNAEESDAPKNPSGTKLYTKIQAPLQAEGQAAAIEIESLYPLKVSDLKNLTLGTWWSLLLIPFSAAAIVFQLNILRYLSELNLSHPKETAWEVFNEALKAKWGSAESHALLNQAFLLKLFEIGEITSHKIPPELLADEGLTGKVRLLLLKMEEQRYAGKSLPKEQADQLLEEAKDLFGQLRSGEEK